MTQTQLMPAIAELIAVAFPELNGRAVAVSDATITRENMPDLPLAMVAFAREQPNQPPNTNRTQIDMVDHFVVEFWFKPARYSKGDGTESPFWGYYDYEAIRNRFLSALVGWLGPNKERIRYMSLMQETSDFAYVLTFGFQATYQWCPDEPVRDECSDPRTAPLDGRPITDDTFRTNLCKPRSVVCQPCETKKDPCP